MTALLSGRLGGKSVKELPHILWSIAHKLLVRVVFVNFRKLQTKRKERILRSKTKITVAFQIVHSSIWKLDSLYRLFDASNRFEPFVVICPTSSQNNIEQRKEYDLCKRLCEERGYRYFESVREGSWVSLAKIKMPKADLVFLQNAWEKTLPDYRIEAWSKSLVCYVPYFFSLNAHDILNYGSAFHRKLWRYFLESEAHRLVATKYLKSFRYPKLVVTGYPGFDRIDSPAPMSSSSINNKPKTREVPKIIYAPHHAVSLNDAWWANPTFQLFAAPLLSLAEERQSSCSFTFKPHPLLYEKLLAHPNWGAQKTASYWRRWQELRNGQVEEGDYEHLFKNSDGLIHDGVSFLAEYLPTGKPALYLQNQAGGTNHLNDFGRALLSVHYTAKNREEVEAFIDNVVLGRVDTLKNRRTAAVRGYLGGAARRDSSQQIFREIENSLTGSRARHSDRAIGRLRHK